MFQDSVLYTMWSLGDFLWGFHSCPLTLLSSCCPMFIFIILGLHQIMIPDSLCQLTGNFEDFIPGIFILQAHKTSFFESCFLLSYIPLPLSLRVLSCSMFNFQLSNNFTYFRDVKQPLIYLIILPQIIRKRLLLKISHLQWNLIRS